MIDPSQYRNLEIKDLAESITIEYFPSGAIQPEVIARSNGITYSYGHYQQAFDGLIQHRSGRWHIFLNLDRSSDPGSPRMRYTFGHEMGHWYIDEHRNAIRSGRVKEHPSFNPPDTRNKAEREADYFASCLLMPEKKFREFCHRKPLTGDLITQIASHFKTSITSVCYKYRELSLFPMAIVVSKDGILHRHFPTLDFKYKLFPTWGRPLPPNTAAYEFFQKGKIYKTDEIVFADDWFLDSWRNKDEQFWEKCFYLPGNTVLSVIWKKEK